MKVVEQSQDRLVIEIRPVGLMILCIGLFLLFLILGFGMGSILSWIAGLMGMPANMTGMAALSDGDPGMQILGYASVIPLLVGVLFIKTRRLTFDRTSGQITINTRGVLGLGEKTYPMNAFQGASLSSSSSGDSGTTYRAMLHFTDDNAMVAVTPYGTSGKGPARTVNAINAWYGPQITTTGGDRVVLSGAQATEAMDALEKLGIKINR
jgi:hypothetical protein